MVDASKQPTRMKTLFLHDPAIRVVWLVRDGRAVAWSSMRRDGVSAQEGALRWLKANVSTAALLATVPRSKWRVVRYEDLCLEPERTVNRVRTLAGLPPADGVDVTLQKRGQHFIGGNPMRYRTDETELRLDDQWRRHLSAADLRRFNLVAGLMNRAFGYTD